MCRYKTLHHAESGYVVRCERCGNFHVGFGTTVLAMTMEQLEAFSKTVDEQYSWHNDHPDRSHKMVLIPTADRSVSLVYSVNDLKQLSALLRKAFDRIAIEKLFVFHDN